MNRYWTRIAVGAVLIFCLGLAGIAAVRKGKAEVLSLVGSVGRRLPMQLAHLGFRLDGRRLGEISGFDLHRNDVGELGTVTLRVALADQADAAGLRDCALTAVESERRSSNVGFRCAEPDELDAQLVRMGDVVFEPGNLTRPLYVPRHLADRWKNSGVQSLDASMVTDAMGGVSAQGKFDLRDGHDGNQRGSFSLKADNSGAIISVRDDQGRSLVDFRADEKGVNLNLRDRHGRNLIKLLADSLGAALQIHH